MRRLGSSRAVKSVLEDGLLGQVVAAGAYLTLPGSFFPDNWRCHRETNRGGAMTQLGIHHIDTLQYLLGPVVQVMGSFAHTAAPVDIDDVGVATLTFKSGALAVVTASYVSPKSYGLRLYGVQANLTCTADMRNWPDSVQMDDQTRLEVQTGEHREQIPVKPQDCLALTLDEFAHCIREGGSPEAGAPEGLAALAIVEAALQSFESDSPINPQSLY
jgi:predicted dehydrogenase